jgi:hypothetical protein
VLCGACVRERASEVLLATVALCVDTPARLARYKHIPGWQLGRRIKAGWAARVYVCIRYSAFHAWLPHFTCTDRIHYQPARKSAPAFFQGAAAERAESGARLFLHPHSTHTMPSARSTLLDRRVPNISIGVRNGGTKPLSSDFIFLKLNQENIYVDFTDSHLQLHNFVTTNRKNLAQTARLNYTFSV